MKYFSWNLEKNEILKKQRSISFEEVAARIEAGKVLGVESNPNYKNQKIYIVEIENYAYAVPCIESKDEIFLKTIFPSRKLTMKYLK